MKRIRIFANSVFLGWSYHLIHCGQTLFLFTVICILWNVINVTTRSHYTYMSTWILSVLTFAIVHNVISRRRYIFQLLTEKQWFMVGLVYS